MLLIVRVSYPVPYYSYIYIIHISSKIVYEYIEQTDGAHAQRI